MASKDKDVKIPYVIVEHLTDLLREQEDPQLSDLYIYLLGKTVQADLRERYNPNDKELIQQYNKNKQLIDDLEQKIRNFILTNPM